MDLSKKISEEVHPVENQEVHQEILELLNPSGSRPGSLGVLQEVALRFGLIRKTPFPRIHAPALLIFAADHGVRKEGVSAAPEGHTAHLVLDFLNEDAPINLMTRPSGLPVRVIDVGIDHSFEGTLAYWLNQGEWLFNRKVSYGTRNFTQMPAMTTREMEKALKVGFDMVTAEMDRGCNTLGLGDIGSGSTTSAAVLCAAVLERDPGQFVLDNAHRPGHRELKTEVARKAINKHPKTHDPHTLLTLYGGFEIVALTGAILQAARYRMLILIDGFVAATAVLLAQEICPQVRDYCLFCSSSLAPAHQSLLAELNARPLLNLDLRMGEGSGVALAFPLVHTAVDLLRHSGNHYKGNQ